MTFTKDYLTRFINKNLELEKKKINPKGYSIYELEADATIPSEYILMMHFLGKIDHNIQGKITKYLIRNQNIEGGWPLYFNGETDISATVKAYYALKLSGLNINSKLMVKARDLILKKGGAENSNVFTRITLALFEQIPWQAVPAMPIEIMLLPKFFPFHLNKISYWSRTVLVPLLIILNKKPQANNPNCIGIKEIFKKDPNKIKKPSLNQKNLLSVFFHSIDLILKKIDCTFPQKKRNRSIDLAYKWIIERLNYHDGLGGIFPAMVNSLIALHIKDKNPYKKEIKIARQAIDKLLVIKENEAYCQPCLSPIWDTGWVGQTMIENEQNIDKTINWLLEKEINTDGDWKNKRPNLKPGGWAFQFNNHFYPDVDDSALIGMLFHRYNKKFQKKKITESIERTRKWIIGMQSKNGGWGSFDADNTYSYLNYIPFADHGALLDPPTADVTARCISFLAQLNNKKNEAFIKKGVEYLLEQQEDDGSWFGRWGTNYIYGTWSVLSALNLVEFNDKKNVIEKAVNYIKKKQRTDGGWGEDGKTYNDKYKGLAKSSTPSQTSWAILGLIASGEIKSDEVSNGVKYLIKQNIKKNGWQEDYYTAVGFPKVFYLKYHGYSQYFPLLAISRYKNILSSNSHKPIFGV